MVAKYTYHTVKDLGDSSEGNRVYEFPSAATSNYYKLSDLEQHKFIILQFWMAGISLG